MMGPNLINLSTWLLLVMISGYAQIEFLFRFTHPHRPIIIHLESNHNVRIKLYRGRYKTYLTIKSTQNLFALI